MSLDPLFLQRALELPSSAVGYHLGRELAVWAGSRAVVELPGGEIAPRAFAEAGGCAARPREDIHNEIGLAWARRGSLQERDGSTWLRVRWKDQDLDVVAATWDRGYSRTTCHWVIADDEGTARGFALALAEFGALPPRAVLVFSSGCWGEDAAAWSTIQEARAEDLVVAPGFLERILQDARQFVGGRATYERHRLPYKRGLLFAGPPGNGKTACLRVLLRDLGLPILVVRGFTSRYGEVEQNVRTVFAKASRAAPCALVLEDLDALARGAALSALLNEMDGLGADTGILEACRDVGRALVRR